MTTAELAAYYANLLILQYIGKPKAYATVKAFVTPALIDKLALSVQAAFEISSAVGDQLDILGSLVGVQRINRTFTRQVSLSDNEFRVMITLKLIQNNSGSSLADIQALIKAYFPNSLRVFDQSNMQIGYFFNSAYGSSDLVEIFVQQGLFPKPMGVELASLIYSNNLANAFGLKRYGRPTVSVTGLQRYNTYNEETRALPWLRYSDVLTF